MAKTKTTKATPPPSPSGGGAPGGGAPPSPGGGGGGGGGGPPPPGGGGAIPPGGNPAGGNPAGVFALTPAATAAGTVLDFSIKHHRGIYEKAIKSLFADTKERFNLEPSKVQNFLQRILDRCIDCGIQVIKVPATTADLAAGTNTLHMCEHHGELSMEHLRAYVTTYRGQPLRAAQDDAMLAEMLQESLTEKAFQSVTADRSVYIEQETKSGVLLLKAILQESVVDSSIDPSVVRKELTKASVKFVDLNYNVRDFNEWIKIKVNELEQCGQISSDLKTHIQSAYASSPDEDFTSYVTKLEDDEKDDPANKTLTYKQLMQKCKDKSDRINQKKQLDSLDGKTTSKSDEIMALQAEVKAVNAAIKKLKKPGKGGQGRGGGRNSNGGRGGGGRGRGKGNRREKSGDFVPFPDELKNAPKPDDTNKANVVKGISYWWCTKHDKWGKHSTASCRDKERDESTSNSTLTNGTNNNQSDLNGRTIHTVKAIVEAGR